MKFDHTKIPHIHVIDDNNKEICIRLDKNEDESGKKYTKKEIHELTKKSA